MKSYCTKFNHIADMYGTIQRLAIIACPINHEDITQEVTLKLLTTSTPLPAKITPSWLRSVVRNSAKDFFRRQSRCREIPVNGEEMQRLFGHSPMQAHYVAEPASPDYQQHVRSRISHALSTLSEIQKRTLMLHSLGHSYNQIAAKTETELGTVRSRLYYAKRKMRELLADLD